MLFSALSLKLQCLFFIGVYPSDTIIVQEIGPHTSENTNHVELLALRVSQ